MSATEFSQFSHTSRRGSHLQTSQAVSSHSPHRIVPPCWIYVVVFLSVEWKRMVGEAEIMVAGEGGSRHTMQGSEIYESMNQSPF